MAQLNDLVVTGKSRFLNEINGKIDWSNVLSKPTIPAAANNGTLTIQKNGTNVQTFTANQSTNATANITVPTKVSELTNDSGYTSNVGTITGIKMNGASKGTSGIVDLGTVITAHQDISGKADKATTLAGYGITDAKIASGTITLGSNTITPLTSSSTLNAAKLSGTIPSSCYTDTNNAVTQTETQTSASTGADYEILFSGTADTTTRDEGVRKCMFLGYDPGIGQLKLKYTDDIYAWIDYAGIGAIGDQNSQGSNYYGTFRANADDNATISVQRINSSDYSTTGVIMDGTGDITLDGTTWDGANTSLKTAVSSLNSGKVSKSGDTMTGNLTIRTTNTEAQVIAECSDTQIKAYLFSNPAGDVGVWAKDYQDTNIPVILKKLNGELKIYGDTYSVSNPDKFRSAINAVNKAGDTMTGALTIVDYSSSLKRSNLTIGTTSNNGLSSDEYPGWNITDSTNAIAVQYRACLYSSNGNIYAQMRACNKTTGGHPVDNSLIVRANKDGTLTYSVSSPVNFCKAISAWYTNNLGSAGTTETAFTVDANATYLLITAHNSTASLNTMWILRMSNKYAFRMAVGNATTSTVTVTCSTTSQIKVKTSGGTVNVYAIKIA